MNIGSRAAAYGFHPASGIEVHSAEHEWGACGVGHQVHHTAVEVAGLHNAVEGVVGLHTVVEAVLLEDHILSRGLRGTVDQDILCEEVER